MDLFLTLTDWWGILFLFFVNRSQHLTRSHRLVSFYWSLFLTLTDWWGKKGRSFFYRSQHLTRSHRLASFYWSLFLTLQHRLVSFGMSLFLRPTQTGEFWDVCSSDQHRLVTFCRSLFLKFRHKLVRSLFLRLALAPLRFFIIFFIMGLCYSDTD